VYVYVRNVENENDNVVFVHQSSWQRDMLKLYGDGVCLIDATYKTTIYDMPLFFVCVLTNSGYVNVATFVLCDERKESIVAGLQYVMKWNPHWKPKLFVTDFHEAQISALEHLFPGMMSVIFHLHWYARPSFIASHVVN